MHISDNYCHTGSIEVRCTPGAALAYLSDGVQQGDWTFGAWNRRQLEDNLFVGTSLFDRGDTYVRIKPDAGNFVIYYDVGRDPADMHPRNMIRIVPGPVTGREPDVCIITLMTWRPVSATDEQWLKQCVSHKTEMFIIKDRLENRD